MSISTAPLDIMFATANRTVFLSNIPHDATIEHICNVVRGAFLSNIRLEPEKLHAFITFADPVAAVKFVKETSKDLYI